MNNLNQQIGSRIRQLRKSHEMTQDDLANIVGVDPDHISSVESGSRGLKIPKLKALCEYFQITFDDLIPIEQVDTSEKRNEIISNICDDLSMLTLMDLCRLKVMIDAYIGK